MAFPFPQMFLPARPGIPAPSLPKEAIDHPPATVHVFKGRRNPAIVSFLKSANTVKCGNSLSSLISLE
jgi:hypothetical protein